MRSLILPAITTLIFTGHLAASPMVAHFFNEDSIRGELVELSDDTIRWSSEAFTQPAELLTSQLDKIELNGYHPIASLDSDHYATVVLNNEVTNPRMRDRVRGTLRAVTDETIELETSFAGMLTFRRDMVAELIISDRREIIYAGPNSLEEWSHSSPGDWSYKNGTIQSNGSSTISQKIGTHKRIRVSFDAAWQNSSQFRMILYALSSAEDKNRRDQRGSYYEFVCQSQYAYLRKRSSQGNNRRSQTIGSTAALRELDSEKTIRFEFLQDLTTGWIRLKMNGERIADWRDNDFNHEDLGEHLQFYGDHSSSLKLSNIRVTSWDGVVEGGWESNNDQFGRIRGLNRNRDLNDPPKEESRIESGILLKNGDVIQGEAIKITDGMVVLKTKFKEFELPLARLRTFALRTSEEANDESLFWKPIRRTNDIRAHFMDSGHITFELIDIKDGKIIGRSQTFEEATFDLKAFSSLEFNIYPNMRPQS